MRDTTETNNIEEDLYEQAYRVACVIEVVEKACRADDNYAEADILHQAMCWQYDLIDSIQDTINKKLM